MNSPYNEKINSLWREATLSELKHLIEEDPTLTTREVSTRKHNATRKVASRLG